MNPDSHLRTPVEADESDDLAEPADSRTEGLSTLIKRVIGLAKRERFVLLSLTVPLLIRLVPELIAGPWPIGFDTVLTYAPFVHDVQTRGFLPALGEIVDGRLAPLTYALLGTASLISQASPFEITKAFGPLLYASLALSLFDFSRRGLGWNEKDSALLVIVATLYFLPLRFSWDMYKSTLGLVFLFLALARVNSAGRMRERVLFLGFGVMSVLASEFVAALLACMLLILIGRAFKSLRTVDFVHVTLAGTAVLATLVYTTVLFPPVFGPIPFVSSPSRLVFPYNYVGASDGFYSYPGLVDVFLSVGVLTAMILGPLLPLARIGFFYNRVVWLFLIVAGIGSFSIVILPIAAIPYWHRWLFMLAFPAIILASNGLRKVHRKTFAGFVALVLALGIGFSTLPPTFALPYYSSGYTRPFVPSTMIQNTVPIEDSPAVVEALNWLNGVDPENSILIANIEFIGWARIYSTIPDLFVFVHPSQVASADFSGYSRVFCVYWSAGKGWFRATDLPRGMVEIYTVDRIAIYELT